MRPRRFQQEDFAYPPYTRGAACCTTGCSAAQVRAAFSDACEQGAFATRQSAKRRQCRFENRSEAGVERRDQTCLDPQIDINRVFLRGCLHPIHNDSRKVTHVGQRITANFGRLGNLQKSVVQTTEIGPLHRLFCSYGNKAMAGNAIQTGTID